MKMDLIYFGTSIEDVPLHEGQWLVLARVQ